MRTNLEKFNYYQNLCKEIIDPFIQKTGRERGFPKVIYRIYPSGKVTDCFFTNFYYKFNVKGFHIYSRRFHKGKKPTRQEVNQIKEFYLSLESLEFILKKENVSASYAYTEKFGKNNQYTSSGGSWLNYDFSHDSGFHINKESRDKKISELKGISEKIKSGKYFKCNYCGKLTKVKDAVERKIVSYRNYGSGGVNRRYCSDKCGGYDQMAHEG